MKCWLFSRSHHRNETKSFDQLVITVMFESLKACQPILSGLWKTMADITVIIWRFNLVDGSDILHHCWCWRNPRILVAQSSFHETSSTVHVLVTSSWGKKWVELEDSRLQPTAITHLERKMIWTKPPGNYVPAVNLQGCILAFLLGGRFPQKRRYLHKSSWALAGWSLEFWWRAYSIQVYRYT